MVLVVLLAADQEVYVAGPLLVEPLADLSVALLEALLLVAGLALEVELHDGYQNQDACQEEQCGWCQRHRIENAGSRFTTYRWNCPITQIAPYGQKSRN